MDFTASTDRDKKHIRLRGQFTFADSQKFRQLVEATQGQDVRAIEMDFGEVEFIDSAGLGMLLLMRDDCQNRGVPISIHSMHGQVEKIFMISKFDQLFTLDPPQ